MALQLADRVQVTATANTTVSFTLGAAVTGYQSFSVLTDGNTTYYGASDGTDWEVGLGTYSTAGPTLTRTTILSSSNAGSAVTFASAPTVWIDYPASQAVYQNSSSTFTSVTTPSVTATTTDLTLSAISTGAVKFTTLGGLQVQINDATTTSQYTLLARGSGNTQKITAFGTANLALQSTGGGIIDLRTGDETNTQLKIAHTTSAVNYHNITGSATTKTPIYSVAGSDGNISMAFQPKGTGAIDLAAGSGGVNISNGGTVTAITRTALGTGYTTPPTWSASAPTTAGGVTATGTTTLALQGVPTITSGGTGYTVGDTLTLVGGTFGSAAQLTVSTVSSGVITGVTLLQGGNAYTAVPTNPISVTGGTGSSATFTTTAWGVQPVVTIGNAGSGYVEQPTITFSGGGGSGATAYATVGSTTIVRGLGAITSFYTPAGEAFRVNQSTTFGTGYWQASGAGNTPGLFASGGNGIVGTIGAGVLQFTPNNVEQLRVSNTTSAVDYVQITGSTTANKAVTISAQGSDTDIDLTLTPKGTGRVRFGTYTGTILTPTGYIEVKDSGGTLRRLLVG